MMRFHPEGTASIIVAAIIAVVLVSVSVSFFPKWLMVLTSLAAVVLFALILWFFRNPERTTVPSDTHIMAPADGTIVVIKEVFEKEYFKDNRLQVSIFLSPLNVHVTRYPISGEVAFSKYHEGRYLVAFHPKSSEKNERTTVVVKNPIVGEVLYRQIAGFVARRIVNYAKVGGKAVQGADAGFIKFGSRVDLFLPLNTQLNVKLDDKIRGGEQIIATLPPL